MLPNNPEVFLRMQYGNFMVLPYPHQRAGHALLLWSDEEGVGGGREAEEILGAGFSTPLPGAIAAPRTPKKAQDSTVSSSRRC